MEILGGPLFAVAAAGESHGPAITAIVMGCPPGMALSAAAIQGFLDRRRPGGNALGTPRSEADAVLLLSGMYSEDQEVLLAGPELLVSAGAERARTPTYAEGITTGEPIAAMVLSTATRSADYRQFTGPTGVVRPGHTDLVKYYQSQGYVDVRGGGRSSYRSTIADVIGGSVARLYLQSHFSTYIFSSICAVGELTARHSLSQRVEELIREGGGVLETDAAALLDEALSESPIRALDADFAAAAAALIRRTSKAGDSIGAAVEVVAANVPALCGEPLYASLKVRLMGSLGGVHAATSCEVGDGAAAVRRRGSTHNDPIRRQGYQTNHHGGLIGGITTGAPLVCRVGFKPTATISMTQKSVRKDLTEIDFSLERGRHDPCVGVRAGVTLESRLAIEVMNAVLVHQSQRCDPAAFALFDKGRGR